MGGIADTFKPIFDLFLTPPFSFILVPGIIIIAIILIWYYFLKKPPEDKFEIETFQDVVANDLDEKFKVKGIHTKAGLTQGFDYLGNVDLWTRERGQMFPMVYDPKAEMFLDADPKKNPPIEYDLYIFRIFKGSFFLKLLHLAQKRYIIVKKEHLNNLEFSGNFRGWNINNSVQLTRWGNIFISSEVAEEYLTDIAIKRSHENTLTFLMNYSRKIIYLEMRHSKTMDRYITKKKTDKRAWEDYKKAEGYDEDSEYTED